MAALGLPILHDGIYPTLTPRAARLQQTAATAGLFAGLHRPLCGQHRVFESQHRLRAALSRYRVCDPDPAHALPPAWRDGCMDHAPLSDTALVPIGPIGPARATRTTRRAAETRPGPCRAGRV